MYICILYLYICLSLSIFLSIYLHIYLPYLPSLFHFSNTLFPLTMEAIAVTVLS